MDERELLQLINEGTSSHGMEFFTQLTLSLERICNADQVLIGEYANKTNSITSLSYRRNGNESEKIIYKLKGTPCEKVTTNQLCIYDKNVSEIFPEDTILKEEGIEGYAGVSVLSEKGEFIGVIFLLFHQAIVDTKFVSTILSIFASRASAEMDKIQNKDEIEILQAQLHGAFDNLPYDMWISDLDQKYILLNKKFVESWGNVIGKYPSAIATDEKTLELWKSNNLRALNGETIIEKVSFSVNDTPKHFLNVLSPVKIPQSDKIIGFTGCNIDITDSVVGREKLKQNEELIKLNKQIFAQKQELEEALANLHITQSQLFHSEKMSSLGLITSGVAHEINNPLGAVAAFASNSKQSILAIVNQFGKIEKAIQNLTEIQLNQYQKVILEGFKWKHGPTGLDYRKKIRELEQRLIENSISLPKEIQEKLVDLSLEEMPFQYTSLFTTKELPTLFILIEGLIAAYTADLVSEQAIERVKKTLYALRNFSRLQTTDSLVLTSLEENLETVLILYQYQFKQNVELIKEINPIPPILCYPEDLMQVWTNLIHNALHALKFNGKINLRAFKEDNFAIVEIEDNGPGIPDSIESKIFNPFFTTKEKGEGTGLGLDISRRIVERHKGELTFTSKPGNTCFRVKIPYQSSL
ncbi:MAG: ATP-binding protein [Leptospira sp.]|nr:ATP-binding protein [Leptospira sp.]